MTEVARRPTPLLLGMEWFPEYPAGLNRYFYELFLALGNGADAPSAVVVGPASNLPARAREGGRLDDSLPRRLRSYAKAAAEESFDVDVVDAHFALYAALPVVFGRLRRLPLVVHFQGPWADESRAAGEASRSRLAAKRALERRVYRRARELVVLSGAFKRVLVEGYGVRPWHVNVVPPGVDLARFSPGDVSAARARLAVPDTGWIAVSVRRLVPRTGVGVLLRAWSRLPETDEALLLLVGDGPARRELEDQAARLGVADTVRFLGNVDDDVLVDCYRAADVCVVPSVALEGFGLVALESLACGTPVVTTDAGGLPEAVTPLDPGLVVPARDADALTRRLGDARNATRPLPGRPRCREYAEKFSWEVVASRHRDVYARAAAAPPRDRLCVVYLDHCARLSGGEIALLRLLPALEQVDAHVVLGEDGPLVARLLAAGISVEVFPLPPGVGDVRRASMRPGRLPARTLLTSAAYAARLAVRLRRLAPDLVHTNSLKASVYGSLAARLAGYPVVWHARDRIADDYLPAPAVRLVRALARRLPTAVIANSHATLATLGAPARRPAVVPRPVIYDPLAAPREPQTSHHDGLCVGMVGRIAPWKGQHLFLEAFARAFRDGDERAAILGTSLFGEDAYERRLHELCRELGVAGRVTFAGFREDVDAELTRFDIVVHASLTPEPFGQVVLEAMAAGLPVVVAGAGGPVEVIEDGVNGLLYPPGDANALAERLRRLASDADLRRRLGAAAREKAKEFAPDVIAAQMMDVYRGVLENSRG